MEEVMTAWLLQTVFLELPEFKAPGANSASNRALAARSA